MLPISDGNVPVMPPLGKPSKRSVSDAQTSWQQVVRITRISFGFAAMVKLTQASQIPHFGGDRSVKICVGSEIEKF